MTVSENYYNSTKISISNNKNELLQAEQNFEKMRQGLLLQENKRGGRGSKIGTIAGIGVGIATAAPTMGISVFAAPILLRKIGEWIAKRNFGGNTQVTIEDLKIQSDNITKLKNSIAIAERLIEQLSEIEKKSQKAYEAKDVFTDEEYRCLKSAEESEYLDVLEKLETVKSKVLRIPGFSKEYSNVIGRPVSSTEAVQSVISDLNSKVADVQVLALKRLYPLEQESKIIRYSKDIYYHYLYSTYPQVQATVLSMMVNSPELRPPEKEFVSILERFLTSKNNELIDVALYAIYNTEYKSGNINYQLRKISDLGSRYPEKLRIIAGNVLHKRIEQGTARQLNSEESTKYILQTIVGNNHLRRHLKSALHTYIGSLQDISNNGPSLYLYLYGPPGIGKTTLISRLQEEINQDQYGMIRITMPEVKTLEDLLNQLEKSSPLQGKTIFFDEFQALDNIKPIEEQNRIIEMLKLFFATEEDNKGISANTIIKDTYRLDFKDTILAIATNRKLDQMNCMESGKVGEALKKRIESITTSLTMKSDLREHIEEFIDKFAPYKFYKFAINRHFEDNIVITDRVDLKL